MRLIFQNFILFQLGWLACVLAGASEMAWIAPLAVMVIIAVHLKFADEIKPEIQLILYAILIGTFWDSILTYIGLLEFSSGIYLDGFAPYWIIAMWALFATTLNVSLRWMKGKLWMGFVLGLLGGPAAYYAGHKLNAVQFADTMESLLVIGIGWAVIMPILLMLAKNNNGYLLTEEARA